jgi:hypothetical protein
MTSTASSTQLAVNQLDRLAIFRRLRSKDSWIHVPAARYASATSNIFVVADGQERSAAKGEYEVVGQQDHDRARNAQQERDHPSDGPAIERAVAYLRAEE